MRLRVDESDVKCSYVNVVRTTASREEVVLEMGFSRAVLAGQGDEGEGAMQGRLDWGHRVIVSYPNLKRMALAISKVTRDFEDQHGEIDLPEHRRR